MANSTVAVRIPNQDLTGKGMDRTDGLKEFGRKLDAMPLEPGKVYTFCVWGCARFSDLMNWNAVDILSEGLWPGPLL